MYPFAAAHLGSAGTSEMLARGFWRNRAFTFSGVDRYACDGEGERRAGFFKWDVSEGANVYKFE